MHANPRLDLVAIDSAKWRRDKDRNPPKTHAYVPAAANWLNERFSGQLSAQVALETDALAEMAEQSENAGKFDLLMMPASDIVSLAILKAAQPLLSKDAIVVCASAAQLTGATQSMRFAMQDLAYEPLEVEDYGTHNGSLSAFRLLPSGNTV